VNRKYMYITMKIHIYFLHAGQLRGSRGSRVGVGKCSFPRGSKKIARDEAVSTPLSGELSPSFSFNFWLSDDMVVFSEVSIFPSLYRCRL
jgi:hypothetical protein